MRRVLIIGCPGSGKTTFAKKMAEKTGLPLVHLDRLYWKGQWEHLSREDFDRVLQTELEKPEWIMDGNYDRTLPHRLQFCDKVFFFDMPTVTCLWGITKRLTENYGRSLEDMGGNCPERLGRKKFELCRKVFEFNRNNRKKYYKLLKTFPNVMVFKRRKDAEEYLKEVIG